MNRSEISGLAFEVCALCGASSDLRASHVIPKFVYRWFRETSATNYFRSSESPNIRAQDGWKPRMLCRDCEEVFSSWEKRFSEICFVPLNNGDKREIRYGPWMLKFATSVSWRVLSVHKASGNLSRFPKHVVSAVDGTLDEWSRFLLGSQPHPGRHEQHMMVVDLIHSAHGTNLPRNINRYLTRTISCDVDYSEDMAITYAKMGRFILFGFIQMTHPRRWKGTKLNAGRGRFGQRDIELPLELRDYIFERARRTAESVSQLSDRQRARIHQSYQRSSERATNSETVRAMDRDVAMFGAEAFHATQSQTRPPAPKD